MVSKRSCRSQIMILQESFYQRDICRCLASMGEVYVVEDTSSGFAVDVALPDEKIAIEVLPLWARQTCNNCLKDMKAS